MKKSIIVVGWLATCLVSPCMAATPEDGGNDTITTSAKSVGATTAAPPDTTLPSISTETLEATKANLLELQGKIDEVCQAAGNNLPADGKKRIAECFDNALSLAGKSTSENIGTIQTLNDFIAGYEKAIYNNNTQKKILIQTDGFMKVVDEYNPKFSEMLSETNKTATEPEQAASETTPAHEKKPINWWEMIAVVLSVISLALSIMAYCRSGGKKSKQQLAEETEEKLAMRKHQEAEQIIQVQEKEKLQYELKLINTRLKNLETNYSTATPDLSVTHDPYHGSHESSLQQPPGIGTDTHPTGGNASRRQSIADMYAQPHPDGSRKTRSIGSGNSPQPPTQNRGVQKYAGGTVKGFVKLNDPAGIFILTFPHEGAMSGTFAVRTDMPQYQMEACIRDRISYLPSNLCITESVAPGATKIETIEDGQFSYSDGKYIAVRPARIRLV